MVRIGSTSNGNNHNNIKKGGGGRRNLLVSIFVASLISFLLFNIYVDNSTPSSSTTGDLLKEDFKKPKNQLEVNGNIKHRVAGLVCEPYGGPDSTFATAEMVYWRDIPADASYTSPLKHPDMEQYLTFEPDEGGWNNIRMAFETAVGLAVAMGRTLVMPPKMGFYLLWDGDGEKHKNVISYDDFFHFDSIVAEHAAGLKVISFQRFLEMEAMTGHLVDSNTGKTSFPPGNRTDWTGSFRNFETTRGGAGKPLWEWMRNVTQPLKWTFDQCVVGLPKERGSVEHMTRYLYDVMQKDKALYLDKAKHGGNRLWRYRWDDIFGHPTPVDASPAERLGEMLAHRQSLCLYDEELQNARVVHAIGETSTGFRLLIHFYAYLFFEDWKQDLWLKRFVRDHFRYIDEIQCAAARIVQAVREKARSHGNADGKYDAFHIRRGDFQYLNMHLSAEEIYYNNSKLIVPDERTVFIATDERNRTFFEIFKEHYHVYFLSDFTHLIPDVNPNYYGMLDQLVASRSEVFMGAFFSTFTGYINRMRGYHARKDKIADYDQGIINSYYYVPKEHEEFRNIMRTYNGVRQAFWQQEFPVCWRDIDHDVKEALVLRKQ